MQRSGKEDSTRDRERETERGRGRGKRESVVNGEQRVFQSGFRPVSDPFGGAHGALLFS